jgi:hypothetical protein
MIKPIQLMIAGAQKAGTTSLFRYLAQHPEIHTHPHREMTYFTNDIEYNNGYQKAFSKYFRNIPNSKNILLAKHVMVMYSTNAIKRLYDHNPETHLIVLLRNPIDRAYSAYWYARLRGWENKKTFEEALNAEKSRLQESWYKWRNNAYLYNGIYCQHIERLFNQFGKKQVHVFILDDLKKNPVEVCQKIFRLNGIHWGFTPNTTILHNRSAMAHSETFAKTFKWFLQPDNLLKRISRIFIPDRISHKIRYAVLQVNEKNFIPPSMKPETCSRLIEFFEPHNFRLEKMLELDLSHWNK